MDRRKVFAAWMEELGYEQVSMQLVIRSRLCWEEDWKVGRRLEIVEHRTVGRVSLPLSFEYEARRVLVVHCCCYGNVGWKKFLAGLEES
jgi:hypothetical protein